MVEYAEKCQILEIVWLSCRLDDVNLVPEIRKPFDVLAEGLAVPDSGGSRTPVELFAGAIKAWNVEIAGMAMSLIVPTVNQQFPERRKSLENEGFGRGLFVNRIAHICAHFRN